MKQSIFKASKSQVVDAISKIAKDLDFQIEENTTSSIVLFSSGDLLSFGNRIVVNLSKIENNSVKVRITSRSSAQLQIIDWGINNSLEQKLMERLKKIICNETVR